MLSIPIFQDLPGKPLTFLTEPRVIATLARRVCQSDNYERRLTAFREWLLEQTRVFRTDMDRKTQELIAR